jgi:hypothetical protein
LLVFIQLYMTVIILLWLLSNDEGCWVEYGKPSRPSPWQR